MSTALGIPSAIMMHACTAGWAMFLVHMTRLSTTAVLRDVVASDVTRYDLVFDAQTKAVDWQFPAIGLGAAAIAVLLLAFHKSKALRPLWSGPFQSPAHRCAIGFLNRLNDAIVFPHNDCRRISPRACAGCCGRNP